MTAHPFEPDDPVDHPAHLTEPERIRLVLQAGTPVVGTMVERSLG